MARPKKLTGPRQRVFLENYAASLNKTASAEAAGVSRHTVNRKIENDPEFALAVKEAEADFGDRMLTTGIRRATVGDDLEKETVWVQIEKDGTETVLRRKTEKTTRRSDQLLWNLMQRFVPDMNVAKRVDLNLAGQPGGAPIPVEQKQDESVLDRLSYEELLTLRSLRRKQRELIEGAAGAV